ncbi:MAG: P-loop NTPase fold protein [Nitrospira sp.]|nr:P-loop NTPase fold protein [Nitrospira sp.]MDE0505169.1 P-loop NTPase fold protein [Candidatus Poribacteria bacterium]
MMSEFNDKPIKSPEEDTFGFNSRAEMIAASISEMPNPEGTVIAINGPWGSGKSSLINLIRHHLDESLKKGDIKIVDFKCWWFRGEETLTIAFFRELYSVMEPSLTCKTKIALKITLSKLGHYLSLVDVGTACKFISIIGKLIIQANTAEALHKKLSCALADMDSKFLIIIDDIDRLSPDEAMLIFRLVKSVGGLPNVIYLLAYDRQLAEKIVAERYPSEGPHYLEKIVQASFELPEPNRGSLVNEFLRRLDNVIEEREFGDGDHFRNLFDEIITPEIKTPRDLIRILNPLKVTWPAVKGEVDAAEFLCLETLRVQRPKLYATIRANKILLTGSVMEDIGFSARRRLEEGRSSEKYNKIFLKPEPESEHGRLRDGLIQLFPELERAWRNVDQINLSPDRDRQRRICSPRHFDTYFRFSLSEYQISMSEIEPLIQKAGDFDYIQSSFLKAAEMKLPDGLTRATLLIHELVIRTDRIPENHIGDLLKAIYSIADELIKKEERNMLEGTVMQLHQMTKQLTLERLPLETRSEVLLNACGQATLGYLTSIVNGAYEDHFPTEDNNPKPETKCLMTKAHAVEANDIALARIREARNNGSLIDCPVLNSVLFLWRRVDEEGIRSWINDVMDDDAAIVCLAKAFINLVSVDRLLAHSMPLGTALRNKLGHAVDLEQFRTRANQTMNKGNLQAEEHKLLRNVLEEW